MRSSTTIQFFAIGASVLLLGGCTGSLNQSSLPLIASAGEQGIVVLPEDAVIPSYPGVRELEPRTIAGGRTLGVLVEPRSVEHQSHYRLGACDALGTEPALAAIDADPDASPGTAAWWGVQDAVAPIFDLVTFPRGGLPWTTQQAWIVRTPGGDRLRAPEMLPDTVRTPLRETGTATTAAESSGGS